MKVRCDFPPDPNSASAAREIARAFFAPLASAESADCLLIALNEAVTNCIRHASTPFSVEMFDRDDHIEVVICDFGLAPFHVTNYELPIPGTCEGKLGIPLIMSLTDSAEWHSGNGTTVTLRKIKDRALGQRSQPLELNASMATLC